MRLSLCSKKINPEKYSGLNLALHLVLAVSLVYGCSRETPEVKYEKLLSKAEQFEKEEKFEEARVTLLSAANLKPEDPIAYFKLAEVLVRMKQLGHAVQNYKAVLDLNPNHHEARLRLASLYLLGKQYELAEDQIRKLLETDPTDVTGLVLSANLKAARREYDAARKILEQLRTEHPENIMVYANLADIALAEGKLKEAEDLLLHAISIDKSSDPIRIVLSDIYVAQGRLDEAEVVLQAVVAENPTHTGLRYHYGDFLLTRGFADRALEQFQGILEANPLEHNARDQLFDFYIARKDLDAARKLSQDIRSRLGEEDHISKYFAAREAELDGKRQEALALYYQAIQGLPQFGPVFRRTGLLELSLGKRNEAIEHLNQATTLNTTDVAARLALARDFFAKRDFAQASEHVKRIIERYPRQIGANVLYADILLLQGDTEKPEQVYNLLVKNFPESPIGYLKLGLLSERKGDYQAAESWYRRSLEFDRAVLLPLKRFAAIILEKQGHAVAIEQVTALRGKSKNSVPEYDYVLGTLYTAKPNASADDLKKAHELYEQVLSSRPELLGAYLALAALETKQGDFKSAAARYEQLVEKQPNSIQPRMLLALAYEHQGEFKKAEAEYREILKLDPRFAPAANNLAWILVEHQPDGNLDEALELASTAKEGLPEESGVADTLGWVYHRRGLSRAALPLIEEAVELERRAGGKAKSNPEIMYHLGAVKFELGDREGAKEALESALANGGEQSRKVAEIQQLLGRLNSTTG